MFSGSPDDLYSFGKLGIGLVATLNDGAAAPEGKVIDDWKTVVRSKFCDFT